MTILTGQSAGSPPVSAEGTWAPVGDAPVPAQYPGTGEGPVLLADGRVLLAGGGDPHSGSLGGAAVLDLATGTWTATAPLTETRRLHTMTRLANGRILAAAGAAGAFRYPVPGLTSAELYDPVRGTWTPTGSLGEARSGHSATLLADGRVLVAGGDAIRSPQTGGTLRSAELYDPKTGTWTATGSMTDARWAHEAVLLGDGRVLVVGGEASGVTSCLAFCEVYDPATGAWTPTGSLATPRSVHQATRLADGSVLVTGGLNQGMVNGWVLDTHSHRTTERYDPGTGTWSPAEPMPAPRSFHRAVALASGKVLVFGGTDSATLDIGYRNATLYDPLARRWTPAGGLGTGRWGFGATPLADGRILAVGGVTRSNHAKPALPQILTATAEVFTP